MEISSQLGQGSISVLVDNPATLDHLDKAFCDCSHSIGTYIKLDTGYKHAYPPPSNGAAAADYRDDPDHI